jgi:translation initiation factor IF-3
MRFVKDLAEWGAVEGQPRLEGRFAHVIISPVKSAAKKEGKPQAPSGAPPGAPPPVA